MSRWLQHGGNSCHSLAARMGSVDCSLTTSLRCNRCSYGSRRRQGADSRAALHACPFNPRQRSSFCGARQFQSLPTASASVEDETLFDAWIIDYTAARQNASGYPAYRGCSFACHVVVAHLEEQARVITSRFIVVRIYISRKRRGRDPLVLGASRLLACVGRACFSLSSLQHSLMASVPSRHHLTHIQRATAQEQTSIAAPGICNTQSQSSPSQGQPATRC